MTPDLRTRYLGLDLRNPLVVSACPLTQDLDQLRRIEDAGAAAAVFPSLFEEQIEHESLEVHALYEFGAESFAESLSYFPELESYGTGPDKYLQRLEEAKRAVSIPVIGSLNGITTGGWIEYAKLMQDAGADAIELNIYFVPTDPGVVGGAIETRYLDLIAGVRSHVSIPLAVKLSPFFSAFANFAQRVFDAGADGLVLFNRFVHPDIDLETLEVKPDLELSRPYEGRLPLTWIALLRGRVSGSLAATRGVHTHEDALKFLLVGADVTMMTSSLYVHGIEHVRTILDGLTEWLEERGYESVEQLKGSLSQEHCPDPSAYERANYMKALATFSTHSA